MRHHLSVDPGPISLQPPAMVAAVVLKTQAWTRCVLNSRLSSLAPYAPSRNIIPSMRQQHSGTIVNISSTEGLSTFPGLGVYPASKMAKERISEALQGELAPFGIRMLAVEPGAMRTRFFDPSSPVEVPLSDAYKAGPVHQMLEHPHTVARKESIDPDFAGGRIVEGVAGGGDGWPEERQEVSEAAAGQRSRGEGCCED